MLIKELKILDNNVIKEIREVEEECKKHDGLKENICLDASLNFNKDIKSIFLAYQKEKLIGFLFMFVPTQQEAEIYAYTLPEYRQCGIFRNLLEKAQAELINHNIHDILIVCEKGFLHGKEITKKVNAEYEFTEYALKYIQNDNSILKDKLYRAKLCTPTLEDLEELVSMSQLIYEENYEDSKSMILNTLESESRNQYTIMFNNRFIGIGGANEEDNEISIFGLGILPEYQGKGFGRELLYQIISDLLKKNHKNITLEVNSNNERAFNLYRSSGFEIKTAFDYYRKKI